MYKLWILQITDSKQHPALKIPIKFSYFKIYNDAVRKQMQQQKTFHIVYYFFPDTYNFVERMLHFEQCVSSCQKSVKLESSYQSTGLN